jgi:hypothetical protein
VNRCITIARHRARALILSAFESRVKLFILGFVSDFRDFCVSTCHTHDLESPAAPPRHTKMAGSSPPASTQGGANAPNVNRSIWLTMLSTSIPALVTYGAWRNIYVLATLVLAGLVLTFMTLDGT